MIEKKYIESSKPIEIEENHLDLPKKVKKKPTKVLRYKFLEIIKEWSLYTTAHGFANVVRAPNLLLKLIWILFLLASWVYCSYLIIVYIIQFYSYEVISTLRTYNEVPTLFPVVDICNLNSYDGQEARFYMQKVITSKNISFDLEQGPKDYIDDITDQIKAKIELDGSQNNISLWDFGFYMSQMLISCKFQGVKCSAENFTWYHNYYYGSCYRFNSGFDEANKSIEIKSSTKSGQKKAFNSNCLWVTL